MVDSVETFTACAQAALAHYEVDPRVVLELLNISENGTFVLTEPTGQRSVLRVHRSGYHSERAIRSELAWLQALRASGVVRAPAVLPAANGDVVVRSTASGQERHVVRFEYLPGVEPSGARLAGDFEQLGAITARLHQHARSWRRPPWFTRLTWNHETALGEQGHWGRWQDGLGVGTAEREILGRLAKTVGHRLTRYGQSPDRFGLIHADTRLANLLVEGSQISVIDFDDCGFSWFLYDLAAALSFIEDDPQVPELVAAWLRGYRGVAEVSADEEAEIGTFIMMRRLLLVAWIGSHSEVETAQAMGPNYTQVSCDLAERYLSDTFVSSLR